jgi:hypothetical protein
MPLPNADAGLQRDLIPVNAVIGFLKRDRRWPSELYRLGYRLCMIEQRITVPGIGAAEIDVIALNHRTSHALLWECKSGRTVDERQARVYASATAEHLQRTGNITFPRPAQASVEPVYCCLESDEGAVVDTLRGLGMNVPVVGLGKTAHLAGGRLQDSNIHQIFATGFSLPPLEEVPRFLPANTHTPKERIAGALFATIVAFLRQQRSRFSIRHLLEETFPDWHCMGTDLRRHLSSTANEIVLDLCKNELKGVAQNVKQATSPGEILVEFTEGVLGSDASARTKAFQKLARLAEGYSRRVKENQPYEPGRELESGWLPFPESDSD